VSSVSGSDPHLQALLRAIRLREVPPDAAADPAAALSDQNPFSGTDTAEPSGPPAAPAARPHPSATPAPGLVPGNSDPFAQEHPAAGGPALPPYPQVPIRGATAHLPIDPVTGPVPIGRPVPGAHPEPQNPALLAAAIRSLAASATPIVAPARPAPSTDGMNPADDAVLREMRRLLGDSLTLAGGPEPVAARLRTALAQAQPELIAALPGGAPAQIKQLAEGLTWLIQHLDQPPALVAGCVQLGAALAECGIQPQQFQLVGAALAEAMRAGLAAGGWRQEFDQAWRTTWQHASEWIAHGETQVQYQPTTWTATVVGHERRRDDLAIVRLRPYLPMPYRPGQFARIEVPELPGVWRPYSLAGAPRRDGIVELHVRAKTESGVSGSLVYRTSPGDLVRLRRAEGAMGLPEGRDRDLLMIAGDTGVAPLKALLTEMAATGDPRRAVLFWGVRTLDELYDIEDVAEIARFCRRATVVPVISEGEAGPYASGLVTDAVAAYGEWSDHEVFLAGPPIMLAATSAALRLLGVDPARIHHDAPE
jgi:NAD(P)H-flavin reductase